jgi:hypothetical protein
MNRIPLTAISFAALTLTTLAACESDDDSMSAAACDAYVAVQGAFFGDPAELASTSQAFVEAAPESIADEASTLADAIQASAEDPAAMEAPEVTTALQVVGDRVLDDCDADEQLEVIGVDYAFEGLPEEIEAGRVAIRFDNQSESDEPHEMIIATGIDGQSASELAGLPMEELFQQARPLAVTFTDAPEQHATTLVDLEPGTYLVICTLPVGGFVEGQDGPPADPHSAHGMVGTLTVV